jgi:hypothetical protein
MNQAMTAAAPALLFAAMMAANAQSMPMPAKHMTHAQLIANAMSAGPPSVSADATIITMDGDKVRILLFSIFGVIHSLHDASNAVLGTIPLMSDVREHQVGIGAFMRPVIRPPKRRATALLRTPTIMITWPGLSAFLPRARSSAISRAG